MLQTYDGGTSSTAEGRPSKYAECLKDLQRFLRRDNTVKRPAFFTLSKSNISKSDLVPLLLAYPDNKDVVFNSGARFLQAVLSAEILTIKPVSFINIGI